MIPRTTRSTRNYTLFPYTPLLRSAESDRMWRTWLPIETAGSKNFVCMMLHKVPGAEGPEVLLFRNDCKRETAREVVPVPTGIEIGPDRSSGAALHICDAPAVDSSIDHLSRPRFVDRKSVV